MSAEVDLQLGAFATDLVVQAGAGTGKTHALVTLYLHLLTGLGARPDPVPPSRILVITFTDKAAGELRDRIRARLTKVCSDGLDAELVLRESAERTGRALPDERVLRAALGELTRAPIGTFHATGQALLRRRAIAAGIDPGFALLDAVEAEVRALEAARAVTLDALGARDPGTEALVDQLGFGGRERRGLVEQLAWLRGVLAEEGREATGIAAAYDPVRLQRELDAATAELRGALQDVAALADRLGGKSIANARAAAACVIEDADVVANIGASMKLLRPPKDAGVAELLANVRARVAAAGQALDDVRAAIELGPSALALEALVAETERRYAATKREGQLVDFGDLIRMPRDLLRDHPELAREEAARYDALLVDEFQDTNAVQAELVELLAGASGDHGRRFIVGDRKQSIYEFRGADVAVFTRTAEALRARGATELLLRRSFRSSPKLIELCNALFASAFGAGPAKEPWALAFEPARDALVPVRDDAPDATVELLETLVGDDKVPADVQRRREAEAIVAHMRRCLDGGRRPGELALLLRRYTYLPTYLHALRKAGIPYYVVRGRGFYAAQEVRDLASLLALFADSSDRLALVAVLRSPLCGLSDDALALLAHARALDLASIRRGVGAMLPEPDASRLELLRARLRALEPLIEHLGPEALLRELVDRFQLVAIFAGTPDGLQKIANVEQLVLRAGALERDGRLTADLPGFSRWLSRAVRPQSALDEAEAQIVDERADVVRVMTIHQAKGLEFPVVYVADCGSAARNVAGPIFYDADEGLGLARKGQPSTASRRVSELRKRRGRAESLRLFYVAATRARDRLVFSGEGGRDTWRAALDAVRDRLVLVSRQEGEPLVVPPPPTRSLDVATLAALHPLVATRARSLRVAVTQLHDFALCSRRYHLVHELGLDEARPRARRAPVVEVEDDLALDPRNAGTLAHRLLERCTFGLPLDQARAELDRLIEELGHERADPATMAIVENVLVFLGQDFARALAGKAVRRELPFTLSLPANDGALRVLRGQMDLVVLEADCVSVVDYKHARRGPADDYRFQLEAYAVAAATLYPRAPRVRVGLAYLRDDDPSVHWVDVRATEVLATELAHTAEALAQARLSNERPLVPRTTCDAIGCGFVTWCHR